MTRRWIWKPTAFAQAAISRFLRRRRWAISKHWFKFLWFFIVLGLLNLAGLIACLVGVFVTIPVSIAALMYAYEDILNVPRVPAAKPPVMATTGP